MFLDYIDISHTDNMGLPSKTKYLRQYIKYNLSNCYVGFTYIHNKVLNRTSGAECCQI